MLGAWQSKNPKLKQWCFKIRALLKKFQAWSIRHVDKRDNEEAHEAAQGMITEVFVMKTDVPMYMGRETLFQEEMYLLQGRLPEGMDKSKKYGFLRRASKFMMLDDILFMKGSDMVLRKVPWKEEIYTILEANHEGSCGGHFAMKITLHKILQEGYVWPSIQKDVHHW